MTSKFEQFTLIPLYWHYIVVNKIICVIFYFFIRINIDKYLHWYNINKLFIKYKYSKFYIPYFKIQIIIYY